MLAINSRLSKEEKDESLGVIVQNHSCVNSVKNTVVLRMLEGKIK